jgi:squalene synthase HpnD
MKTGAVTSAEIGAAYLHCEQITKAEARNFSYGIRLLPAAKRQALSAVYAFARRVDDIGDGTMPAPDKMAALAAARTQVTALTGPGAAAPPGDQVLLALQDAATRFPIPLDAFGDLIDGCEADVRGTVYTTFEELERYCRCVAGSIGRLSLGVFGCADPSVAAPLADDLGVALQLTNILRDIREDYGTGRVYLPADDLLRFGTELVPGSPGGLPDDERLQDVVRFEAERARGWYATGLQLLPLLDRRSAASAGAMAGIYRQLLEHIAADPAVALSRRLSLTTGEKAAVAARSLAGMTRPAPLAPARRRPATARRGSAHSRSTPSRSTSRGQASHHSAAAPRTAGGRDGRPRRVVVIGGGLAGITAAIALRETGAEVTLLEARPRLGGATSSFARGDLSVDNGQHVYLACCTAYRGLLDRLGVAASAPLQDRFDVTVLAPGRTERLRRTSLPGPLQLGQAMATYGHLSAAERLQAARATLAMRFLDPADPALDDQRLGDWLARHGQTEHARRVLWDLFTVSTMNIAGDDANLALAAKVVQTALLGTRDAADIGMAAIPLGELHGTASARLLSRLGAGIRLATSAVAITPDTGGGLTVGAVSGADRAESQLPADGVVLALPPAAAARLLPAEAGDRPWTALTTSPIVNVHAVYDRRVTDLPFAAAVDSPLQWVFDKTASAGLADGQYLAVSLSAADSYIDVPAAQLGEQFLPALAEIFPAARQAQVKDFFVTRERHATFRQAPGSGRLRPPAATRLPGLVLAGAWTDTGWPDTMEGAVRSGLAAARELRRGLAWPPAGGQAALGSADTQARAGASA